MPKARDSSSYCCPTLLQEMLCSRPARMVPSITHGLILAPPASSRRKKGASSPPRARASAPTWPPPWSSAQLSACPGHPSSGHCLVCFSGPRREGRGERKGRQLGKGKREEGEGPPSLIS
ncbi:hypothetical protein A6R68_12335 [Neotoma lepida]|uniref:Uncharacterized protein n=1 Tax=Neotoma lepida TaxID=56216 RepID=A0A1A6H3F5_NEOLE|nr:hypothetical protein A6R68_12335 [Neotoma lepida]